VNSSVLNFSSYQIFHIKTVDFLTQNILPHQIFSIKISFSFFHPKKLIPSNISNFTLFRQFFHPKNLTVQNSNKIINNPGQNIQSSKKKILDISSLQPNRQYFNP